MSIRLNPVTPHATNLSIRFLRTALDRTNAVGRLVVRDIQGQVSHLATGFLVSDHLVMTCHHVIPTAAEASRAEIQFDYFERQDGSFAQPKIFQLDPSTMFISDVELDFVIVAVVRQNASGDQLTSRGCISMDHPRTDIVGGPLSIIQHGGGEPMQVSLRDIVLILSTEKFLKYIGETREGSAGAPVFNDAWELVGIHHAAVFAGSQKVCEGIKVSAVLSRLLSLGASDVLREVLPSGKLISVQSSAENRPQPPAAIVQSNLVETLESDRHQEVLGLDLAKNGSRDSVFVSYAHADQEDDNWKDRISVQLRAAAQGKDFRIWDDGRIAAGADWRQEIRNALHSSRVAVLLVGPNFLLSEFIQKEELPAFLDEVAGVQIMPVITHHCPYHRSALGRFQSVNDPNQPLESLPRSEQNRIMAEVAEKVAALWQ